MRSIVPSAEVQRENFFTIVSVANCIPTDSNVSSSPKSSSLSETTMGVSGSDAADCCLDMSLRLLDESHFIDNCSVDIAMHCCSTHLQKHDTFRYQHYKSKSETVAGCFFGRGTMHHSIICKHIFNRAGEKCPCLLCNAIQCRYK